MRAINLIPDDQRRGAGGAAGKSGGAAHFLVGGLALLVALTAAYVVTDKSATDKKAELASVTEQAVVAEAKARSMADYTKFTTISAKRVQTVTQLADSRFDWAHSLREVARVLPENAWLTDLSGTVAPNVAIGGASSTLRGALAVPAIAVQGCTTSQASVAKMMARMRLINGVQRVSLENSEKNTVAAATGDSAGGGGDCRAGSSHFPKFSLVVFFEQSAAVPSASAGTTPAAATTSSTPTTAASTTAPASSTAPATTTTPAATPAATGGTTP